LQERSSPELVYLETKFAAFVSYGLTVELLKEVLPSPRMRVTPTLVAGATFTATSGSGGTVALQAPTVDVVAFFNSANNWTSGGSNTITVTAGLNSEL
jgi:uncharacterized membrane protein